MIIGMELKSELNDLYHSILIVIMAKYRINANFIGRWFFFLSFHGKKYLFIKNVCCSQHCSAATMNSAKLDVNNGI